MPTISDDIADAPAALRRERGLTHAQIAALLGTHRTSYSKMEAGTQDVPLRGLVKLAREFGITVDEALGRARPAGVGTLEPSSADAALAERLRLVDELDDDDRAVLLRLIDTFVSKQRFKTFVQENIGAL